MSLRYPTRLTRPGSLKKSQNWSRKKLEGISDLRDESDRSGMSIYIELKRDANPQVVLNQLYKHTQLQDTFGVIMLALVDGEPRVLNLKQMLLLPGTSKGRNCQAYPV